MHTACSIRRHINLHVGDKPFSIRDFLQYGSRNAVDQVFHRLVKSGRIKRIARGVFIKNTSIMPTVAEVAKVKAKAFCKTIAIHGAEAACSLGLESTIEDCLFATTGSTSSFKFGKKVIRFVHTSARKMYLGDSKVGLAIRALWHLGKFFCVGSTATCAVASFQRTDRQALRQSWAIMPAWMNKCFPSFNTRAKWFVG